MEKITILMCKLKINVFFNVENDYEIFEDGNKSGDCQYTALS